MYIVLVKTAVVEKILVVLNKIDNPAIGRGKVRLEEFKDKRTPCVGPGGPCCAVCMCVVGMRPLIIRIGY